MTTKSLLILLACFLALSLTERAAADEAQNQMVRLAKLEIHREHLEAYKAALKEEIEASIRLEPGVLALRAVSEKANPTRITIMEIYASVEAYKAHIESAAFPEIQGRHPAHGEVAGAGRGRSRFARREVRGDARVKE